MNEWLEGATEWTWKLGFILSARGEEEEKVSWDFLDEQGSDGKGGWGEQENFCGGYGFQFWLLYESDKALLGKFSFM